MSAAPNDPTGIVPSDKTYLTHRQVEEYQSDIQSLESNLSDPKARLEDRPAVAAMLRRVKSDLEVNQPPDTTPEQRDALSRMGKDLLAEIVPAMNSQQEMRKNPSGSVGKYLKGEGSPEIKGKILQWKNVQRTLNKGSDDPDVSNLELHRHRNSTLNLENAQIPGKEHSIPSPQFTAHYDQTFNGGDAQADPSEVAALRAQLADLEQRISGDVPMAVKQSAAKKPAAEKAYTEEAPCGFEGRGTTQKRAEFGARAHARSCVKCTPPEATA